MRGTVLYGTRDIRFEEVSEPKITKMLELLCFSDECQNLLLALRTCLGELYSLSMFLNPYDCTHRVNCHAGLE
jgi:hypothetical protein